MNLLDNFFYILQQEFAQDSVYSKITLNHEHKIFEGHFPGVPIVPGVCMVQIIVEIMKTITGKAARLATADFIKYPSMIVPEKNKEIDVMIKYHIEPERLLVNASLYKGAVTFFKLKAAFTLL